MDENIPITILKEDNDDNSLINTALLFDETFYPNSKATVNELILEEQLSIINSESLDSSNDDTEDDIEDDINKSEEVVENKDCIYDSDKVNMDSLNNLIQDKDSLNNLIHINKNYNINKNIDNITSMDTHALNFIDHNKEDNTIYIERINYLESKVKDYEDKKAKKIETKYSFIRTNKINIIENYIKKYNLKYEFNKEHLLELDDEEFNKIYYNIYNINESRKNSLMYYGVCLVFIWLVDIGYKKISNNSNKNLFQKFTFEIFHDNLADSFIMFENEYFPANEKFGNPILNIFKFLMYFCCINLLFDSNIPSNLKI